MPTAWSCQTFNLNPRAISCAYRAPQASTARTSPRVPTLPGRWPAIACSIISAIAVKRMLPSRNRATATSFAAFRTTGRLRSASRARSRAPGETGERVGVGRLEIQPPGASEVECGKGSGPAVGIRERVLNGQPHVRDAELGDRRPVCQFHHRMDDRLRVDDHVDLIRPHAEQPARLDDFEALVHQSRRVDRDLAAHAPRGMVERGLGRDPASSAAVRPRNGPPDAVSTSRRISGMRAAVCRHW